MIQSFGGGRRSLADTAAGGLVALHTLASRPSPPVEPAGIRAGTECVMPTMQKASPPLGGEQLCVEGIRPGGRVFAGEKQAGYSERSQSGRNTSLTLAECAGTLHLDLICE